MDEQGLMRFMQVRRDELARIARYRRDRVGVDDLLGEIWLAADEAMRRLHHAIDFDSPVHQLEVLIQLRRRLGRADRRAGPWMASLDQPVGAEDDGMRLIDLLPAHDAADPQAVALPSGEDDARTFERLRAEVEGTYSQVAAYLLLFDRVGGGLAELAGLLCIGLATLRRRLAVVIDLHRVQARLFDGVAVIEADFLVVARRPAAARPPGAAPAQSGLWPATT